MTDEQKNRIVDYLFQGASMKCTLCGEPPGCRCWVRLECPVCHRHQTTEREGLEPLVTPEGVVFATCPDCHSEENPP